MSCNIYDNFVVNPTVELTPSIRISPFIESDLLFSNVGTQVAKEYLKRRFNNYLLTLKARDAISLSLSYYSLKKDDVVTILTTSNNFYISSCVTNSIETICSWSREITDKTKLIFINHEFGYPVSNLNTIKQLGLPIIEDCAHSFISNDSQSLIGKVGDFVIYSLPKFFSMQIGGVLVSNKYPLEDNNNISLDVKLLIFNQLSLGIPLINDIKKKRLNNYTYLVERLKPLGIIPYFELDDGIVPGVFLFKWDENINYTSLKIFMQNNGIESSVFYGENAFFIPVHHKLEKYHLDYMVSLLKYFKNDIC